MKKLSLFAFAVAALLLGACSSDKDELASDKFNQYGLIEGQSSWLSLGIALPSDPVTRSNQDLNDGVKEEFEVKSALLVLFKGATEASAVIDQTYEIKPEWQNETADNVPNNNTEGTNASGYGEVTSTTKKLVQQIKSPELGAEDNLYAYVVLNYKGNLEGNLALNTAKGTKFDVFQTQVLKAIGINQELKGYGAIGENGLVMTSVPISDKQGGDVDPTGANITALAKLDKGAIYPTREAAVAGTSVACIYVERAAVKIELKNAASQIVLPDGKKLDYTFEGWALGNVNNGTAEGSGYYNIRQFDPQWLGYYNNATAVPAYLKYRMVGNTAFFANGHTKGYRTYFGKDVNYNGKTGLVSTTLADADFTLGLTDVTYTYENTFDENSQIWDNTTYVGVKLKIGDQDFYTIENQPDVVLLSAADIDAAVKINAGATIQAAISAIQTAISADLSKAESVINAGRANPVTQINFTVEPVVTVAATPAEDGSVAYTYTLKLTNITATPNTETVTEAQLKAIPAIKAALETEHSTIAGAKIYKYVGGVSYYYARISHFGDVETPWSAPNSAYNNYDLIYPTNGQSTHETPINYGASRAAAWLGRWGIVRNNWYRIEIQKISSLGSPVPPTYPGTGGGTPDDNPPEEFFISAHVHILPWAVRSQAVDL